MDTANEARQRRARLAERDREERTDSDHTHRWVSGMMYVHEEDVHATAMMRRDAGESLPECETCEEVYAL